MLFFADLDCPDFAGLVCTNFYWYELSWSQIELDFNLHNKHVR